MHCTYRDFLMRANYAHPTYPKLGILSWGGLGISMRHCLGRSWDVLCVHACIFVCVCVHVCMCVCVCVCVCVCQCVYQAPPSFCIGNNILCAALQSLQVVAIPLKALYYKPLPNCWKQWIAYIIMVCATSSQISYANIFKDLKYHAYLCVYVCACVCVWVGECRCSVW